MPGFEWFGDEERKEVMDVLDTGVLFRYGFDQARKGHWKARSFEKMLAKKTGSKYCHLCSSGTSALITALSAVGVGAGDEVIVPPFTFIATIESVLSVGAIPVFGEIDETLCLDPQALDTVVTERTKAVLLVHMCGSMAQIDAIVRYCDQKGLILIEGACQSLGATYQGQALGTFGVAGCYSFDPVKTVTCGEGGALVTDEERIYNAAHAFADHGHDHIGNDRGLEDHLILGSNFRISELNAAVGLAQLQKLDAMIDTQRFHKRQIKNCLKNFSHIRFRKIPDEQGDSATFLTFFLPDEINVQNVVKSLGQAGVDGCFYWYANNWHYFRKWDHLKNLNAAARLPLELIERRPDYNRVSLPASDRIMQRAVSMQIKLSWTESDVARRVESIEKVFNRM